MQADHGLRPPLGRKAPYKARFKLRRQIDFGHHHQGLRLGLACQELFHGLQIHLGLAAAGGAKKQKWPAVRFYLRQGLRLLCAEGFALHLSRRRAGVFRRRRFRA